MCKCVEQVNEKLAEKGDRLAMSFGMTGKTYLQIRTARLEGRRGRPSALFASHCPFCGRKFPDADASEHKGRS